VGVARCPFLVSTRSRHHVSAEFVNEEDSAASFQVPLTVSDVHLRHEQLPFAYFFRETLDAELLKGSLRRVLQHFPVVGGKVPSQTFQAVHCDPLRDTIPLAFGDVNATLDEWLSEARGHVHIPGQGHPVLLPLFDALFEQNDKAVLVHLDDLVKIRVTHFQCGGTAIGVNILHALGDTASCVRFVQCWGREMQKLEYPRNISNRRASVCVSGMMTEDIADLMGLAPELESIFGAGSWRDWWLSSSSTSVPSALDASNLSKEVPTETAAAEATSNECRHEYLQLRFPSKVLNAMKEVGMAAIAKNHNQLRHHELPYVSTNDLVTAFGWLLKRALSGEHNSNISMVVNMRGRCGVESFTDMTDFIEQGNTASDGGLFGNGITNFVAEHPSTNKAFDIWDVVDAAGSIRLALKNGMTHLPERMVLSRMGKASSFGVSTAMTFPTTSWGQFPLRDISFSANKSLVAFHGHPSHPLPPGQSTYSSVVMKTLQPSTKIQGDAHVNTRKYGMKFNLLLPSTNVEKAKQKHQQVCESFLSAQSQMQKRGTYEEKAGCN
jgi:Transferase family